MNRSYMCSIIALPSKLFAAIITIVSSVRIGMHPFNMSLQRIFPWKLAAAHGTSKSLKASWTSQLKLWEIIAFIFARLHFNFSVRIRNFFELGFSGFSIVFRFEMSFQMSFLYKSVAASLALVGSFIGMYQNMPFEVRGTCKTLETDVAIEFFRTPRSRHGIHLKLIQI